MLKYASIVNSSERVVASLWNQYKTIDFIVQHKYDGANFQIIFNRVTRADDGKEDIVEIKYASRNMLLSVEKDGERFFNFGQVIKKYQHQFDNISKYLLLNRQYKQINLFGELYGNGVQKRVKYFEEAGRKELIFFDVCFDGCFASQKELEKWANEMNIPLAETFMKGPFDKCQQFDVSARFTRTTITAVRSLREHDGELPVGISPAPSQIEGVVLKPYDKVDNINEHLRPYYIKIKQVGFEEINKKCKQDTAEKQQQAVTGVDLTKFELYLTSNRVKNVLSKQVWTLNQMYDLGLEILLDAFEDYVTNSLKNTNVPYPDLAEQVKSERRECFLRNYNNKNLLNKIYGLIRQEEWFEQEKQAGRSAKQGQK